MPTISTHNVSTLNNMSCKICKRSSCTESFHSLEAQEEWDRLYGDLQGMDESQLQEIVVELRYELEEARKDMEELESEIEGLHEDAAGEDI